MINPFNWYADKVNSGQWKKYYFYIINITIYLIIFVPAEALMDLLLNTETEIGASALTFVYVVMFLAVIFEFFAGFGFGFWDTTFGRIMLVLNILGRASLMIDYPPSKNFLAFLGVMFTIVMFFMGFVYGSLKASKQEKVVTDGLGQKPL
ncbi:MAG: hypothetical protein WC197_07045 [Candidatus Gastranaerophilaceae bacterium]|jgi:hypothetical protein